MSKSVLMSIAKPPFFNACVDDIERRRVQSTRIL